jgi:hypothetical protein
MVHPKKIDSKNKPMKIIIPNSIAKKGLHPGNKSLIVFLSIQLHNYNPKTTSLQIRSDLKNDKIILAHIQQSLDYYGSLTPLRKICNTIHWKIFQYKKAFWYIEKTILKNLQKRKGEMQGKRG